MLRIYAFECDKAVLCNDYFFNTHTYQSVSESEYLRGIIEEVEGVTFSSPTTIISKFTGQPVDISKLSTSCKTFINILVFLNEVFSISECGTGTFHYIFNLKDGSIFCVHKLIPFELIDNQFEIIWGTDSKVVNGIDDLEGWWDEHEDDTEGDAQEY